MVDIVVDQYIGSEVTLSNIDSDTPPVYIPNTKCELYIPKLGDNLIFNTEDSFVQLLGNTVVINNECVKDTASFFELNISHGFESSYELKIEVFTLLELTTSYDNTLIGFEFLNTINLSNNCGIPSSNFNLCETGQIYSIFSGAVVSFELDLPDNILLILDDAELGSILEIDLLIEPSLLLDIDTIENGSDVLVDISSQIYFNSLFETASETELNLTTSDYFYPIIENGSGVDMSLYLPPRAYLESNYLGGSEIYYELSTQQNIYTELENGSEVEVYLTPACITPIELDTLKLGYLENDCLSTHRVNRYAKYYTFSLLSTKEVTIDLSASFDTYLYLMSGHGDSGAVITSNDDGGVGANSKITTTLAAGDYTVETTSFSYYVSGAFNLYITTPSPNIDDIDFYAGSELSFELARFQLLDVEYETGSESNIELEINPFDKLEVEYETGSELNTTFLIYPQFEIEYETGSESNIDLEINPFDKLEVEYETGIDVESELTTLYYFDIDFEYGTESTVDLSINPFDVIDVEYCNGFESIYSLYTTTTFRSYAYFGSDVEVGLTIAVSEGIGFVDNELGVNVEISSIETEEFTIFNEYGSVVSIDIENQVRFESEFNHGTSIDVDIEINPFDVLEVEYETGIVSEYKFSTTTAFNLNVGHGSYSDIPSIYLPPRAFLDLNSEHGSGVTIHETVLHLRPFEYNVGLDFHVQHNHCESCCDNIDPIYNDSTLRLSNKAVDSKLLDFDFSLDNFKDDYPWTLCEDFEIKYETNLTTNPRLNVNIEVEGSSVIAYMPREILAFHPDVPIELLYLETDKPLPYAAILEVEFESTIGAYTWDDSWTDDTFYIKHSPTLTVELTETRYVELTYDTQFEISELTTYIPEWRSEAFHDMVGGISEVNIVWDQIEYTRFCHGYILPAGNQINFEYSGGVFTDCNVEWIYFGDSFEAELQSNPRFITYDMTLDTLVSINLTLERPWELDIYPATNCYINLTTNVSLAIRDFTFDAICSVQLEQEFWYFGGTSALMECELSVPGPDFIWYTQEGCLSNEYIETTDSGDIDYLYYQPDPTMDFIEYPFGITIENRKFKHNLDARCITEVVSE